MKKTIVFLLMAAALILFGVSSVPVPAVGNSLSTATGTELPGLPSDTTVTVTIVKIVLSANSITLKDGSGKLWEFVVDPLLIDLRKYKVGQTVTATISKTFITDKVTRARITKMQLIKLQ